MFQSSVLGQRPVGIYIKYLEIGIEATVSNFWMTLSWGRSHYQEVQPISLINFQTRQSIGKQIVVYLHCTRCVSEWDGDRKGA